MAVRKMLGPLQLGGKQSLLCFSLDTEGQVGIRLRKDGKAAATWVHLEALR